MEANNASAGLFRRFQMKRRRETGNAAGTAVRNIAGEATVYLEQARERGLRDESDGSRMMARRMALTLALLPALAPAAEAACEADLALVERVVPTLVLSGDLRREAEALQTEAQLSCNAGDEQAGADAIAELWRRIIDSDDVTPPTVVELTLAPCGDGMSAVEQALAGGEAAGETSQELARQLIDEAQRLCRADDSMAAEQKLALAWSILADPEE